MLSNKEEVYIFEPIDDDTSEDEETSEPSGGIYTESCSFDSSSIEDNEPIPLSDFLHSDLVHRTRAIKFRTIFPFHFRTNFVKSQIFQNDFVLFS